MKKLLIASLFLALPVISAEETDIGFHGALPEDSKWQNIGSIKVESVEEAGVKALSFVDESESGSPLITYPFDREFASRMREEGYTLDIRLKHVLDGGPGGNFSIIVGLPGLSPLQISPYGQKSLLLSAFDFETQKSVGVGYPAGEDFIDVKAVYRPSAETGGGTCEIIIGGQASFTVRLGLVENSPRSAIEIGGRGGSSAERTGRTFVESLKLSIP